MPAVLTTFFLAACEVRDALAGGGQAKNLRYQAAAGDAAELDATGLAQALDLARFLLKHAILSGERARAGAN